MPEFLELLPPQKALDLFFRHLAPGILGEQQLPLLSAVGRVTSRAVTAVERLPAFDRSTVDGYAVSAGDTFGASESLPVYMKLIGEIPMGGGAAFTLQSGQLATIHTGGMLPPGADAVVMLEHTQTVGEDEVEVLRAVAPRENVILAGEDIEVGAAVIQAGERLGAEAVGSLLALGHTGVWVARQPRIAIISTGDEIVPPETHPSLGQVRDVNSGSLSALVALAGGIPHPLGIIPDQPDRLESALAGALQDCDAVVITAGSSASTRDLTAAAIEKMGSPGVLVHGVNVKPGKPTILGVCAGKGVIGLPGNPVSALVIARLFVVPLIERLHGYVRPQPAPVVSAVLAVNLASQAGREDYIPVRLLPQAYGVLAEPVFYKSNLIFSLASADGYLVIPPDATGLPAGSQVQVIRL
ncbi:MAG: molybdopterin molybdenumtransferase MoeA [Anaerolineae bacterium]|nr:molybdopterin molybdenumtransferase MoeA [Anaerolineae bacterium]